MSLKAKIITKIKAKVKADGGYNLSNSRINGLADKLDAVVDSEDDIDGEIEKLDGIFSFKEMAALDDSKRNADKKAAEEAAKADKDDADDDAADKADADKSDKKGKDEAPIWFKTHVESQNKVIEALTNKLAKFEQGSVTQSRKQQLEAKLKDAPEKFKARTLRDFDRMKLDTDEDFDNYLAEVEQDVADEIQAQSDAGLGGDNPPLGLGGGGKLKDTEVSPEMKQYIADRKAGAEAKANASA